MGFFNNTNQLLTNIEWKDQVPNTLVWRFPNPSDVLQRNSTVTVTQNQAMVFYNDGKPEGAITEPGQYDLKTNSLPFFSSMMAVFRGGETKHKAQVYFVNTLMITNVKWGTIAPINYIDPLIQQNVGLRAFGNYSFQIADAGLFVHNYIGNRDELTLDEFQETITGRIITPIGDALATAQYGFTEIASHRDDLSKSCLLYTSPSPRD